jgi:hypothetical protein
MQQPTARNASDQGHPPTIKASARGKQKIKEARESKGWKYNAEDDDTPLKAATKVLEPENKEWWERQWKNGERQYAVAAATWKRFQNPSTGGRIRFEFFEAFCQILDLPWQEIAELDDSGLAIIGDPPDLNPFYGRTWYLNELRKWIVQERSCLVAIYGQPGIGKTSLIRQFIEHIKIEPSIGFEEIIWLTPSTFFPDLFRTQAEPSTNPIGMLFELLKKQKSLIVLDRWTEILGVNGCVAEYLGESYDSARLLQKIAKQEHTNSLILISDEKPAISSNSSIHSVQLEGFGKVRSDLREVDDDKRILEAEGLYGEEGELSAFLTRYGNPSVLKSVAARARTVFGGNVAKFVGRQFSIFLDADFDERLDRVWNVLSRKERIVMYWLAIRRESRSFDQLEEDVAKFGIHADELIELLYSLIDKQSLVERNEIPEYELSIVWQKFATQKLIQESSEEIFRAIEKDRIQNTELFLGLAFVTFDVQDERIEAEQVRRIVMPVINELVAKLQERSKVCEGLERILAALREHASTEGYGIQNIEVLLSKLNC